MERENCQMSGSQSDSGVITMEDLEGFSEEGHSDSAYNSSLQDDAEQERLLNYWQNVGRGHQVEVPRDMAEPIQQLTRNNRTSQEREIVPFRLISQKEKCGEILYEERLYEKAKWACITVHEKQYEQSICLGFMKLMRYICEQNSTGTYLGLTIPVVTIVHTEESRTVLSQAVTVAYYLPLEFQNQPPQPNDTEIMIQEWPTTIVYSRTFRGTTNEQSILHEINMLAEALDFSEICLEDSFIMAGYTNPAARNRHNEIWFLRRL
ncbi:heme-binding protein soul3 [Erpetoichthys calabaricus]|uniref:Heme-binding protein soul3 n=1 Tax=Erpetoichthys calabaricus TaxID=27687 RepID=A0A8C4XFI9_ERPCA|nr:heme-binding protein soul3 [Erpetoichthys calabaricus]